MLEATLAMSQFVGRVDPEGQPKMSVRCMANFSYLLSPPLTLSTSDGATVVQGTRKFVTGAQWILE